MYNKSVCENKHRNTWESAMLINLSDALTYEGRVVHTTAVLEMTEFRCKLGIFPITEKSEAELKIANAGEGKAHIQGGCKLVFQAMCDRCLSEVPITLALSFDRTVTSPDVTNTDEEEDGASFMEGYQLDVEAFMYNEILENWPVKILCKEDCKGVCPKCGKNLNNGECGCDTFVPDPRMAAIQDIFNANKEV